MWSNLSQKKKKKEWGYVAQGCVNVSAHNTESQE